MSRRPRVLKVAGTAFLRFSNSPTSGWSRLVCGGVPRTRASGGWTEMANHEAGAASDPLALKRAGPLDVVIGGRIRAHREARGLSAQALGRKRGFTAQQITKYEAGRSRIPAATLRMIGALLDVPVSLLLPADRASPDPRVARIQAIVAELNRIEDSRFLAALLALITAARDYRAYAPTR
jgi:transcriptional regulator with XRE-family HTH domain